MALDLAFDVAGDGPPLVVLHGMFGSATNWRSIAQRLSAAARVYTVDLRNHGRSPWSDRMTYPEMAEDVLRLFETERLGRPMLMGHSMGGKTAMALALLAPEAISHLVVVDIAPVSYQDRMSTYVNAMLGIDVVHAATRNEIRRALSAQVPETGIVGFLMQNLVERNAHFDWRVNLPAISAAMQTLCSFPAELAQRRYEGPATAIAGQHSNYIAPADAAAFQPMFPTIAVESIADAGHWVHADRPDAFLDAVRRALALPG